MAFVLQGYVLHWVSGVHHTRSVSQCCTVILRGVPRGVRHLSQHSEHRRLGIEQRRGELQTERIFGDGDQFREYQRRCELERGQ